MTLPPITDPVAAELEYPHRDHFDARVRNYFRPGPGLPGDVMWTRTDAERRVIDRLLRDVRDPREVGGAS